MEKERLIVPMPEIASPHWKVGDSMGDSDFNFVIHQLALVQTTDKHSFELRFYDETGKCQGTMDLKGG